MTFRHTSRSCAKVPAEEVDSYFDSHLTNEQSRSQSFCITPRPPWLRESFTGIFQHKATKVTKKGGIWVLSSHGDTEGAERKGAPAGICPTPSFPSLR